MARRIHVHPLWCIHQVQLLLTRKTAGFRLMQVMLAANCSLYPSTKNAPSGQMQYSAARDLLLIVCLTLHSIATDSDCIHCKAIHSLLQVCHMTSHAGAFPDGKEASVRQG